MNATMRWAALAPLVLSAGLATLAGSARAEGAEAATVVTYQQVHALTGNEGRIPGAAKLVKGPDGKLYGTAESGGTFSGGTVFRMTTTGATQVLHALGQAGDGKTPLGMTWGPDGNFYGVTSRGGSEDRGTFYRMSLDGVVTILHSFSEDAGLAWTPSHAVTLSSDGHFYGVTTGGGGAVYRITTSGALTLVHTFEDNGIDGRIPWGGLIEDGAGNLYGTTYAGGIHGKGIVFRVTKAGVMKILHAFGTQRSDGAGPSASLVRVGKMLYGVTWEGGARNEGTVFRVSTAGGSYARLHSFSSLSGAPYGPIAGLVQGADGYLYGTTTQGGTAGDGTVYRISLAGALTRLHSFGELRGDGTWPTSGLLPSGKTTFYGTTDFGGVGDGTVYKLTVTD